MARKQISEVEKLLFKFPAFQFEGHLVTSCCDNCIGENCLIKEPTPCGLCSNYKFSEKKFNGEV
jgi:hypothetical protein